MSFGEVTVELLNASKYTIGLFFLTLLIAIPLGMVICACSMSKFRPVKYITSIFVWIIRGTPLMLQIIVVFYGPGLLFGTPIKNRFLAALIAFAINYGVYFSEIYRGGIQSMPNGQYEAGKVLGMNRWQINNLIIFPQVAKKVTPAMSNEVITLVKDTSLANIIAIGEIILTAKDIVAGTGIIWPLFYTGVFYLAMIGLLTIFFKWLEKKMNYYRA